MNVNFCQVYGSRTGVVQFYLLFKIVDSDNGKGAVVELIIPFAVSE